MRTLLGAEQLAGGTEAREHLQKATSLHKQTFKKCSPMGTQPNTHNYTPTVPPRCNSQSLGKKQRQTHRMQPLPPYQLDCHHSNQDCSCHHAPLKWVTARVKARDRQTVKRAKDRVRDIKYPPQCSASAVV